jgi:transcriptional regulator with XRE-family HTH domain
VVEQPELGFAELLRQLRTEAELTQEGLAEAAGLSPRSVSDLERGINRTARQDTAVLLAEALGLAGAAGELFVAAARSSRRTPGPTGAPPGPGGAGGRPELLHTKCGGATASGNPATVHLGGCGQIGRAFDNTKNEG